MLKSKNKGLIKGTEEIEKKMLIEDTEKIEIKN